MRTAIVQPPGVEHHFGDGEFIVSKTVTFGMITYANDAFLRVSGYAEHDLLGKPHTIIRHPDMPRSVSRPLWSTIQHGEEIFAYVVNLARDGTHYWVFAHVTPSFRGNGEIVGYHSNRRSPEQRAVAQAAALYRMLRQEEARRSSRPRRSTPACDCSRASCATPTGPTTNGSGTSPQRARAAITANSLRTVSGARSPRAPSPSTTPGAPGATRSRRSRTTRRSERSWPRPFTQCRHRQRRPSSATIEAIDDQADGFTTAATGGQGDGLPELGERLRVEPDRLRPQS
ncbi:MAG: PAS domain-containing protein [Acidimicrobiia bacterium]